MDILSLEELHALYEIIRTGKAKTPEMLEYEALGGKIIIGTSGWVEWHMNGKCHRDGGPAAQSHMRNIWFQNGQIHRADGPASESADNREWKQHGLLHREGGQPSQEILHKGKWVGVSWHENGRPFREKDLPHEQFPNGAQNWFNNLGQHHRESGPAKIYATGRTEWFLDGKRHRENGPAIVGAKGKVEYFFQGKRCASPRELEMRREAYLEKQRKIQAKQKAKQLQTELSDEVVSVSFVA